MDYPGYIEARGKSEAVAEELLRSVVPEIFKLEGQEVTTQILQKIQIQQDSDENWAAAMGYLDFITDDRDREWHRLYVGQCINSLRRLINGHAQQILKAEYGSLHHFIVWLGNGSRSANFIRLWMIEDEDETDKPKDTQEEEWKQIKMNLLEALFCKAFSTHHGTVDPHTGTRGADNNIILQERPSFGLNLMTPLAQNGQLIRWKRSKYLNVARKTPDQQISLWLEYFRPQREHRLTQITKELLAAPRQIFRRDFQDCLQDALQDKELFEELKVTDLQHTEFSTDPSLVQIPFFGNQKAKVGFILDYAAVRPEEDILPVIPDNDGLAVALPPSLRACNFKESNVLVWTFNFRKFVPLASQTMFLTQTEERELCIKNYKLINTSQARIIFLCGPRAEKITRLEPQLAGENSPSSHLKHFVLKLRGFQYNMYVTPDRQRIFIRCPSVPCQIWSRIGIESTQISEAIRFAVGILHLYNGLYTDGIFPFDFENISLVGTILCHAKNERLEIENITSNTIEPSILLWLDRKELKEQTLREVAKFAKSFSRGLLMILHALPRRSPEVQSNRAARKAIAMDPEFHQAKKQRRVRCHEEFDKEVFRKVTEIVQKCLTEEQARYEQALSNLPPDESWQAESSEICTPHYLKYYGTAESMGIVHDTVSSEQAQFNQSSDEHHTISSKQGLLTDSQALPLQPEESHILDLGDYLGAFD